VLPLTGRERERERERENLRGHTSDTTRVRNYNYFIISSGGVFRTSGTKMRWFVMQLLLLSYRLTSSRPSKNNSRLFQDENGQNNRARNCALIRIMPSTCLPIANANANASSSSNSNNSCALVRTDTLCVGKSICMPINLRLPRIYYHKVKATVVTF